MISSNTNPVDKSYVHEISGNINVGILPLISHQKMFPFLDLTFLRLIGF